MEEEERERDGYCSVYRGRAMKEEEGGGDGCGDLEREAARAAHATGIGWISLTCKSLSLALHTGQTDTQTHANHTPCHF